MYLGWTITVAVLLPNLLMLLLPPQETPAPPPTSRLAQVMEMVERVGQVGVFIIPCFYRFDLSAAPSISLVMIGLMLVLYYTAWARYALRGHTYRLLFSPLLGLPLPLAVSPVIYFGAAAFALQSWFLAMATILFGLGHLYISYGEYRRCHDAQS